MFQKDKQELSKQLENSLESKVVEVTDKINRIKYLEEENSKVSQTTDELKIQFESLINDFTEKSAENERY